MATRPPMDDENVVDLPDEKSTVEEAQRARNIKLQEEVVQLKEELATKRKEALNLEEENQELKVKLKSVGEQGEQSWEVVSPLIREGMTNEDEQTTIELLKGKIVDMERKSAADIDRLQRALEQHKQEVMDLRKEKKTREDGEAERKRTVDEQLKSVMSQLEELREELRVSRQSETELRVEMERSEREFKGKMIQAERDSRELTAKIMEVKANGASGHERKSLLRALPEQRINAQLRRGHQWYDVVLRIEHLLQATNGGGWPLRTVRGLDLMKCRAIPVTVLGGFAKGKTWLLTRLARGVTLGTGISVETQGISLRLAKLQDNREVILIDTAGKGQAIEGWTRQKSEEARAKESFVMDVAYHMAQIYLYVVELMEEQDQDRLHDLLEKSRNGHGYDVVVVHNLKNITTEEQWNERVKYLVALFEGSPDSSWHYVPMNVAGFDGTEAMIGYLNGPHQRHYFLGCEGEASGAKNDFTFKAIMDFIGAQSTGATTDLQQRLLTSLNAHINAWLTVQGTLELDETLLEDDEEDETLTDDADENVIGRPAVTRMVRWRPSGAQKAVDVVRTSGGRQGPSTGAATQKGTDREPAFEVFEMSDNRYLIQIAAPGVPKKMIKVKVERKQATRLILSGKRTGDYVRSDDEEVRQAWQVHLKQALDWEVSIDLPTMLDVPRAQEIKESMKVENGMVTLNFTKTVDE